MPKLAQARQRQTMLENVYFTGNLCKCDSEAYTPRKPLEHRPVLRKPSSDWKRHWVKETEAREPRGRFRSTSLSQKCPPRDRVRSLGLQDTLPLPHPEQHSHSSSPTMMTQAHRGPGQHMQGEPDLEEVVGVGGGALCYKARLGPQR